MSAPLQLALEQLVDGHGLKAVLEALAETCALKVDHLAENWPGALATRKIWDSCGKAITKAADSNPVVVLAQSEGRR